MTCLSGRLCVTGTIRISTGCKPDRVIVQRVSNERLGIFSVIELLGSAKINHECHDVYHIVIVLFKCVEVNGTGD